MYLYLLSMCIYVWVWIVVCTRRVFFSFFFLFYLWVSCVHTIIQYLSVCVLTSMVREERKWQKGKPHYSEWSVECAWFWDYTGLCAWENTKRSFYRQTDERLRKCLALAPCDFNLTSHSKQHSRLCGSLFNCLFIRMVSMVNHFLL